jgi:hypothetical protein
MSSPFKTPSDGTNAQLQVGTAINSGFALWDPFQLVVEGWSRNDYYVVGCSKDWFFLNLIDEFGKLFKESLERGEASDNTMILPDLVGQKRFSSVRCLDICNTADMLLRCGCSCHLAG